MVYFLKADRYIYMIWILHFFLNQIKSSCLGIALSSHIQGEVSIHCVLRFFSLDLYKVCVPITPARLENIKTR